MIRADELVVDNFAGGGGASTGIEAALGRDVDIAIDHSPEAIAMHQANHPRTRHFCESVWAVNPREACAGRPVGLAHFSPDCTHFSRAKGGKPRDKKTRGLAWVALRWAREVRPRVIVLENVEEFLTWGPVDNEGQPIERLAGRTFECWLGKLRALGYAAEWRLLNAADYGAPTTRKRLFLVARCDGEAIRWPVPTHGKGTARAWRGAHEVIDWTLAAPSIFGRKKPLAEATMRRIAAGLRRYVIESAQPFVVKYHGGESAFRGQSVADPLRTVDTSNRFALVSPTLVEVGHGERPRQAPRVPGLAKPFGTVVCDQKHGLVAVLLTKHYGGVVGHGVQFPLGTITTHDHHALKTAALVPAGTDRRDEVRAFLEYYDASGRPETQQSLFDPLHTVTTKARFGLVTVHGKTYEIADIGMRMLTPRELFRAQSFPDSYVIDAGADGRPLTKTAQIELAGNSVCPVVERAVVEANLGAPSERRAAD